MTMKILDQEEWNELMARFRFNSILSVIGEYPLYLQRPSDLIYTNPGNNDNQNSFSVITSKPLNTETKFTLIEEFIKRNTFEYF